MRLPRLSLSRRAIIVIAVVAAVVGLIGGGLLAYPRIGAWMVRSKVVPRLEHRLGRDVRIGSIDVRYGHAVLEDLVVAGPRDGRAPLVHVDRVDVDFDFWSSLVGTVRVGDVVVHGVHVAARRDADGADNFQDVADRLRGGGGEPAGGAHLGLRPARLAVEGITVAFSDEGAGVEARIGDGDADWRPGQPPRVTLRGLDATTATGPSAKADRVVAVLGHAGRSVTVEGGRVALWPKMALTGIGGTVREGDEPGRFVVDLAGGYGGVDGTLWTAKGWLDPDHRTASIALDADRFTLDRLRPILERSAVLDYGKTSVDASLQIDVDAGIARFAGGFHLHDLTVSHPMLAAKPVRDLDVAGDVAGSFDRQARVLSLDRGDFVSRKLPFQVTGHLALRGGRLPDGTRRPARALDARFVIPPVPCQQALDAIPPELAPYMVGFDLRGTFDTDLHVAIDWSNLEATDLGGHVAIRRCKVKRAPDDVGKRLLEPFEQYVELDQGNWTSFIVGPDNPDFVPLEDISPHLINSIMSTEDSAFYQHHGYIPSEFKSALIKDLQAGGFKYGASSITMQMVKNVLLYKEKTLARKLQELFLTWYVETILPKDRILEIYLNVIEYGPGLYGIGPAARHYFGKDARDLTPREAAFFSSILPAPKKRYEQYCKGTLQRWTVGKLDRILAVMHDRKRLSDEDYALALNSPLVFVKDGTETEAECLERTREAIKNARSTNPMRKGPPRPKKKPHHHHHRRGGSGGSGGSSRSR
jgi:Transglycosylase